MRSNGRSLCLFGMTVLAMLLGGGAARAQTSPSPSPTPPRTTRTSLERRFFKNILSDQEAIWAAPFHIQHQAKWLVPFSVGTMALITTDRMTGDEIGESNRPVKISRAVSYAGSAYGAGAVAAAFYFAGRGKNDMRAKETGLLSAEALVDSAIVSAALKKITQRGRPLSGRDRSEFFDGGSSFPSGHSMAAWSVATIIADEYHDRRAVQVAAYGVASAVSVARFTGHKHYLSDVLVGSAIGYGIGQYVFHARHQTALDPSENDLDFKAPRWPTITMAFNRGARQYGVAVAWTF